MSVTIPSDGTKGSYRGIDYAAYQRDLSYDLFLINRFWSRELPRELHARYVPHPRVLAYDVHDVRPECDGKPDLPHNADYCPPNNTVSFDGPGFLIPFYSSVGPAADAVILAHEWGHAVQARLGIERWRLDELRELNADCWAGVWARDATQRQALDPADLDEATRQLFLIGDPHSVNWRSPQAHGTPAQRVKSFSVGVRGGVSACLRQAKAWSD